MDANGRAGKTHPCNVVFEDHGDGFADFALETVSLEAVALEDYLGIREGRDSLENLRDHLRVHIRCGHKHVELHREKPDGAEVKL